MNLWNVEKSYTGHTIDFATVSVSLYSVVVHFVAYSWLELNDNNEGEKNTSPNANMRETSVWVAGDWLLDKMSSFLIFEELMTFQIVK